MRKTGQNHEIRGQNPADRAHASTIFLKMIENAPELREAPGAKAAVFPGNEYVGV
jgi:hypothetical protein